jgi:hypothetical protein
MNKATEIIEYELKLRKNIEEKKKMRFVLERLAPAF